MEFETPAQQACYAKIEPWLRELYPSVAPIANVVPAFAIDMGSATAIVEVLPWDATDALVCVWAYVVTDLELAPDLLHYLMRQNCDIPFGIFSLDVNRCIRFHISQVGSTCDRMELQIAVAAVLETADRYDDEIVMVWGGKRALDRARERLDLVEAP